MTGEKIVLSMIKTLVANGPSGFYVITLQGSLSLLAQSGESLLVGNSDLGQHLTVQSDACLLQTVHEGGVVHTVSLAAGGDR